MNIQVNYRYTLLALPWIQQFWCMCGHKKKKPSEYKHWSKDSQLNPLKLILCWLFQVPVLSICKQYLNTFTTAALQVDNFSLIKKKTFISSFLVIMKGLEAKILSKWILNPWIFLNNTQNTFSIWTSIMNSELFGWALHQSCTHDQRINGSPVYPLRALRGQCPGLSLWMWSQWYANSYCGFQGPCCVAAMIWSEFVFLLTQSLLHAITIMLNHREFINTVMR